MTRSLQHPCVLLSALAILFVLNFAPANAQNEAVLDTTDAEANDDEPVEVTLDGEEAADNPSSADRSEALQRRAGEQVGDDPSGRAAVLGMYVQEADNKRVKVIEVAAASPAFDAGIREGDAIISFDGFKADSYRDWVDGIRNLVNDASEGDTMPIVLVRDGKNIHLRLRKPVARADDLPSDTERSRNQELIPPGQPQTQQQLPPAQQPQPGPASGGSGGVGIGVGGGLGGSGQQTGATTDRAVAEIFRLDAAAQTGQSNVATPAGQRFNGQRQTGGGRVGQRSPADSTSATPGAATGTGVGGQQIGLAGFSNSPTGMVVMLDVGGLAPGNYLVGIDDAGTIGGGGGPGTAESTGTVERRQSQLRMPAQSQPRVAPPNRQIGPNPGVPARQQPANRRGGVGGQPQSNNQPRSHVPPTILAQVLDLAQNDPSAGATGTPAAAQAPQPIPSTGQAQLPDTPPSGQVGPLDTDPTGRTDSPGALPNGQARQRVNTPNDRTTIGRNAQDPIAGTQDTGIDGSTNGTGPGVGPLITIGMLTVDESGTGRMQQPVEGVQVQHVVGQAIVIYMQQVPANNTLPPNLDAGADPRGGTATGRPQPAVGDPQARQRAQAADRAATQQTPGTNQQPNGSPTPIAAGTIRLVSDQASPAPSGVGTQPSANLPESGEELR